jgi:primosomal protein N' (replication factor Y)
MVEKGPIQRPLFARRKIALARQLRKNSTSAEGQLWSKLRRTNLNGYKFRRQHPIGPYVADFACASAMLVVELDGAQHEDQAAYDERRTDYLRSRGWRVIRFHSTDVFVNVGGVLEAIYTALEADESGG